MQPRFKGCNFFVKGVQQSVIMIRYIVEDLTFQSRIFGYNLAFKLDWNSMEMAHNAVDEVGNDNSTNSSTYVLFIIDHWMMRHHFDNKGRHSNW